MKNNKKATGIIVFSAAIAVLSLILFLIFQEHPAKIFKQSGHSVKETGAASSTIQNKEPNSDSAEPFCGNNIVERGEVCDDGNTIDADDCSEDCSINRLCKDGIFRGDFTINNYRDMRRIAGCISITGKLVIESSDIVDLNLLKSLNNIKKGLYLRSNGKLKNIDGLDNLVSVGVLVVQNNPVLKYLEGFRNLNEIAGGVEIARNEESSADPQPPRRMPPPIIYERSVIGDNATLIDLSGIGDLSSVETELDIENNASLKSINGISKLASIKGLAIRNNPNLVELEGLNSLGAVEDSLIIEGNSKLKHVNELGNLLSIRKGSLIIVNNNELSDINGLRNIAEIRRTLIVRNNDALTSLDLNGLRVTFKTLAVEIIDNDGLDSIAGIGKLKGELKSIIISGNRKLINLQGLNEIQSIRHNLSIENNASLIDLKGLNMLTKVGMSIKINSNDALKDLSGLDSVTTVGYLLEIKGNKQLTSLRGLDDLEKLSAFSLIGNNLYVSNNGRLATCDAVSLLDRLKDKGFSGGAKICGNLSDTCGSETCK